MRLTFPQGKKNSAEPYQKVVYPALVSLAAYLHALKTLKKPRVNIAGKLNIIPINDSPQKFLKRA